MENKDLSISKLLNENNERSELLIIVNELMSIAESLDGSNFELKNSYVKAIRHQINKIKNVIMNLKK